MTPPAKKITVDDLRRKAEGIKGTVQAEAKRLAKEEVTTYVTLGAVALFAAISLAYYMGTRRH